MKRTYESLRENHEVFHYRSFQTRVAKDKLVFQFVFEVGPDIQFRPQVEVLGIDRKRVDSIRKEVLDNLCFNLGMMEIPSYWKATCSPEIVVECGYLDEYQLSWWKELFINGLGEFFYVNKIDFTSPDFMDLRCTNTDESFFGRYEDELDNGKILVPISGGKDSAVTYEILRIANKRIHGWFLSPTRAALDTIRIGQKSDSHAYSDELIRRQNISTETLPRDDDDGAGIVVRRTIDKTLLDLNRKGYMNGHTPFSAYLGFLSVACAVLFNYRRIAFSDERSSNEGNVNYRGRDINHQYSKSFEYEKKFREYAPRYLARDVEYFSFLRPLYELQISRLFSQHKKYFGAFRSCNRGQKNNLWCHKCPKCLFIYVSLYPFVDDRDLTTQIFSSNLFEDEDLIEVALQLLGLGEAKPFECVGSWEETKVAFYLSIKKTLSAGKELPVVLKTVQELVLANEIDMDDRAEAILNAWNSEHALPGDLEEVLRASCWQETRECAS